jgi:hypothetical protein
MHKEILFIEKNTPELRNNLLNLGLKKSLYCNEGIYLSIENNTILQLNHKPYQNCKTFKHEDELLDYIIANKKN